MNSHSILAVTDLSQQGNRALIRAAMLAEPRRALLKIMYTPSDFRGSLDPDVEQQVKRLAREVHTRFNILAKTVADPRGGLEGVAKEARWADMLVVGEHWKESAGFFFRGMPIERLQRLVPCPVLLARLEVSHRYRRILVAIDSTSCSKKLLKLARRLDGGAQIEPFQVGDSSTDRRNSVSPNDVARQAVIQQQHSNADLIVVGRSRGSGFSEYLFGSVAHRVLRWSGCDVCLVPHDLRIDPIPGMPTPSPARHDPMATRHLLARPEQ
ncbi:universal stress protein [Variovorax ginsengisoli]|uniref:Universal stress protein n=1 Tax=Variovorax ginsengisoli TaxID=363844 RepID=A0ABT8S8M4_9BURK|nr:universal stress protein [Variovorax ginsengisoli]MDN8616086.1 universal stress protein [Variovorax ginsengisoli]MDO1535256.1 universal stress protein [Variovorax ginsengisoli]